MDNTQAPASQASVPAQSAPGTARLIDSKAAIAIINKRITVTPSDIGSSLQLSIQGTGQFLQQGHKYTVGGEARENKFDRMIYNVRASSSLLMTMAENKKLFTDAMKAESAGDTQEAHKLFNAFLNATQLSFSVISNGTGTERKFNTGDDIKARVVNVVSQAGNSSLQLEDVSYIAPKVKLATKFEISELIEA